MDKLPPVDPGEVLLRNVSSVDTVGEMLKPDNSLRS